MPRYYQPVSQADTPPGQEEQQQEEVKLPQAGQTRYGKLLMGCFIE